MSIKKGQNLRLKIGDNFVAAATSMQLHIAVQTESVTTKDSTNEWDEVEPTGVSWDVSSDALVKLEADSTGRLATDWEVGSEVSVQFVESNGAQNRENASVLLEGKALVTDISLTAANRQNSTISVKMTGNGELTLNEKEEDEA